MIASVALALIVGNAAGLVWLWWDGGNVTGSTTEPSSSRAGPDIATAEGYATAFAMGKRGPA